MNFLVTRFPVSQRRVGRLLEQPRSTQCFSPTAPSDFEQALRARLRELAKARPRFGYRRLLALLNRDGFRVTHKRVQRLCRDDRLRVRVKKRKRARLGQSTNPSDRLSATPLSVGALIMCGRWISSSIKPVTVGYCSNSASPMSSAKKRSPLKWSDP